MYMCSISASQILLHDGVACVQVAENSVLFMAYGLCQKAVAAAAGTTDVGSLSPLQNATAGFFAAFFSSLVLCPTELVKCKMQAMREMSVGKPSAKRMYKPNIVHALRLIFRCYISGDTLRL